VNIFFLDLEPKKCAEYHVDRHVVKIILEACQMMATAYPKGGAPYKHTHANHPMAIWVRSSLDNFIWTLDYCYALCSEYTYRYGKRHKSQDVADWFADNLPNIDDAGFIDPPRCFGEIKASKSDCIVKDYQDYYRVGKTHLFKWSKREKPSWL
jgi:hypothetical protein